MAFLQVQKRLNGRWWIGGLIVLQLWVVGAAFAMKQAVPASKPKDGLAGLSIRGSCFGRFESYGQWMDFLRQKNGFFKTFLLSFQYSERKYNRAREDLYCRHITYPSDNLIIHGYLVRAKNAVDSEKMPVILFNRGGNQSYGAVTFAHLFNYIFPLARKGYLVLVSQYRGSVGSSLDAKNGQDEFGGHDVNDVVALIDLVSKFSGADSRNIFMVGQSRGAMMTMMALKRREDINAVATIAGEFDLAAGLSTRPEMEKVYRALIPDYLTNKQAALRDRSALYWAQALPPQCGILLLHGSDDRRVDVASAYRFDKKLTELGREHRLVVYEGDDHFLADNHDSVVDEIDRYFRAHLKTQQ